MVCHYKSHHKTKYINIHCQNESLQTVVSKVKDTCTGFTNRQLYRAGGLTVNDISYYKTFMLAVNDITFMSAVELTIKLHGIPSLACTTTF